VDDNCPRCVLTINSGSSSLKSAVYQMGPAESRIFSANIERIGLHGSHFCVRDAAGVPLIETHIDLPNHDAAIQTLLDWLGGRLPQHRLDAVGHRVVHGGAEYSAPRLITADVVATLQTLIRLAPNHLPHELTAIEAIQRHYADLRQVACFDTAFHRHMPELAQRYPMPRSLWTEGVLRYGFHGLSYEYICGRLREVAGDKVADGRVVVAHLGNGASMAAIHAGRSVDTTMGFTPAGGLMMGTRSGDLDPGVILYLLEEKERSPSTVDYLVNQRSGLIGVSGSSSDMSDLLRHEASDPHAAQAVEMFCYQAKKFLGAMVAVLGGLDTLIFTGGVGTNAPAIRQRICQGLEFMGIRMDGGRNETNAAVISAEGSPATVRVMKTDEELMIARHTARLLASLAASAEEGSPAPPSAL
jgi:acetate kinase